ncbi:MAG: hypothetical protein PHV39_02605 [Methanomicrobium sp.]|nr:hypothetical protein [Methanomicrobium sp.]
MYELLGIYISLLLGFGGLFAYLFKIKDEITAIRIEFAKCPWHGKQNFSTLISGAIKECQTNV